MTVILINCVTLGMYQPCEDTAVCLQRCQMLKVKVMESNTNHICPIHLRLLMISYMPTSLLKWLSKW